MEREAGEQKIHNETARQREIGECINLAASLSRCEIIAARNRLRVLCVPIASFAVTKVFF
jgi:hypothetical protein